MLCRGGVTFVNKMDQFIWGAQSVDNTPSDLNSESDAFNFHRLLRISRRSEASIKEYARRKIRCGRAAIKGGGRPTRLLPQAKMLLVPISFFSSDRSIMLRKVLYFYWATCFTLRGHCTHIDLLWFLFLVCRICPLIQEHF